MTFGNHATSYNEDLQKGLRLSGEGADFFAQCRVKFVKTFLDAENEMPGRILEFGTGTGNNVQCLKDAFPKSRIVGVDISEEMLQVAKSRLQDGRTSFSTVSEFHRNETVDLVFVNGVFHHIPAEEQKFNLSYIVERLRSGGLLTLFDNNPFNPGARWVMKKIPFDHDAVMVNPYTMSKTLLKVGFATVEKRFYFLFPKALRVFRFVEPYMEGLPLGAQYCLYARKS